MPVNKSFKRFALVCFMMLVSGSVTSTAVRADEALDKVKDEYVNNVVGILRTHVSSMRLLVANDIKYSDNLVRHAKALERAFGMLGPMDFHVADALEIARSQGEDVKLTEEEFEHLAKLSEKAMNKVTLTAENCVQQGVTKPLLEALNEMMTSCGNCHHALPKGATPAVWKGMIQ